MKRKNGASEKRKRRNCNASAKGEALTYLPEKRRRKGPRNRGTLERTVIKPKKGRAKKREIIAKIRRLSCRRSARELTGRGKSHTEAPHVTPWQGEKTPRGNKKTGLIQKKGGKGKKKKRNCRIASTSLRRTGENRTCERKALKTKRGQRGKKG